jgi:hypothetical protein
VVVSTNNTGRRSKLPAIAEHGWTALSKESPVESPVEPAAFDPATLADLPPPAQRLLGRALPSGVALSATVELSMEGEIALGGRWFRFTAEQLLRAGDGFVWSPVVGGRLVRFVGADLLTANDARMEFRLHGLIPVVRAAGSDVRRSAQGRLAGETVAWLPQALTPQLGARWNPVDDERAVVTLNAAGADIDVEVVVDSDGRIRRAGLDRWNGSVDPPRLEPFGASVDSIFTASNGVCIAGSGAAGWGFGTDEEADGIFFRYRITRAAFSPS